MARGSGFDAAFAKLLWQLVCVVSYDDQYRTVVDEAYISATFVIYCTVCGSHRVLKYIFGCLQRKVKHKWPTDPYVRIRVVRFVCCWFL